MMNTPDVIAEIERRHGMTAEKIAEEYIDDCCCPAACRHCGTVFSGDLEHDATNVTCKHCGRSMVDSLFVLMGII